MAFAAGLCHCSLFFDLGALDSSGGGALGSSDSSDTGSAPPIGDDGNIDAGEEGGDDGGGEDVLEATLDLDSPLQTVDSPDDTATGLDAAADAAEASSEGGRVYDASRDAPWDAPQDAPWDAPQDAPHDAPPPFDAASCASALLTVSPTAVASSTRTQNLSNMAIDKQLSTRWESTQQVDEPSGTALPPQWIYVDFGARVSVTRVRIDWQNACASVYALQVSEDASTWVTLTNGNVTNPAGAGSLNAPTDWSTDVDTTGLSGTGRYLRVYGTQRCLQMYGYSIWEMEFYGHGISACPQGM